MACGAIFAFGVASTSCAPDKARWAYAATKMIDWKPVRSLDEILDDVIRHEKSVAQAGA